MVFKEAHALGDFFISSREKGYPGLPLLSVTLNNGLVVRDTLERRTETSIDPEGHLLVREGSIAYNMMRVWQGALGRAEVDGLVSPAYVVLEPTKKVDSKFAEYLFKTPRMIYLFWAYSYGLTKDRLRLYFNDFSRIPVTIPPLGEQRRIAQILCVWDEAISITKRLIGNSQKQKKGLMHQLLTGRKRFPGFSEDFKRYHFSDLVKIDTKSLGKSTAEEYEFYYISLSDVEPGRISRDIKSYKFKNSPSRARRIVSAGDILLATVRPNLQGFARVTSDKENCVASTGFAVLTPHKNICGDYVYHYLFSDHVARQINSLVVGTNYPAINSSDVSGLSIYCPSFEEQKRIAGFLNDYDEKINKLMEDLNLLKQEKKALMQKLFDKESV